MREHNRKKTKEAKKLRLSGKKKVEKDPGIPNDWPFKEQELKALEARRAKAIEELEQKKAERKERVIVVLSFIEHTVPCIFFLIPARNMFWFVMR